MPAVRQTAEARGLPGAVPQGGHIQGQLRRAGRLPRGGAAAGERVQRRHAARLHILGGSGTVRAEPRSRYPETDILLLLACSRTDSEASFSTPAVMDHHRDLKPTLITKRSSAQRCESKSLLPSCLPLQWESAGSAQNDVNVC